MFAYKESQMGIPGFEGMGGKFRSAETVILNWAGSIFLKKTVSTALYSKCCVKSIQEKITGPCLDVHGLVGRSSFSTGFTGLSG